MDIDHTSGLDTHTLYHIPWQCHPPTPIMDRALNVLSIRKILNTSFQSDADLDYALASGLLED